jgi:sodium pump decarboxylase gamma subunit
MQELGLMERFADPSLFGTLGFGEKMVASLVTTLLGMGVTFAILILLWFAIAIMARLLKTKAPKEEVTKTAATQAAVEPTVVATDSVENGQKEDLVAVIMAAIAAKEGSEIVSNLIVRKISRISGSQTAWRTAGSADCIDSRKI